MTDARDKLQELLDRRAETGRPLDESLDLTLWRMCNAILEIYNLLYSTKPNQQLPVDGTSPLTW
jgi:hypothetical protein